MAVFLEVAKSCGFPCATGSDPNSVANGGMQLLRSALSWSTRT